MPALKGITWAHTRGVAPLQATSQVYSDFHPDVTISWDIRSLLAFGEGALEDLTKEYDFLLIDHPFMGMVADQNLLLPLDQYLSASVLQQFESESVGKSFHSYQYNGHQWALPIDAAAQVAAARTDLLLANGYAVPQTWDEVMKLAQETRKVAIAFSPMGLLGSFFTLCANQGEAPFSAHEDRIVSNELGEKVLIQLRDLWRLVDPICMASYPPQLLNRMATNGDIWYVPIAYPYVNYSMEGYAPNIINFYNLPAAGNLGCAGATLGGVGLAISPHCQNIETALEYATWVTGATCQRTLYSLSGGQAGNKAAWQDDTLNSLCHDFYKNTAESLEKAFVRPRYNGFHGFQSYAGRLLQDYLKKGLNVKDVLNDLNSCYLKSTYLIAIDK